MTPQFFKTILKKKSVDPFPSETHHRKSQLKKCKQEKKTQTGFIVINFNDD